MLQCYSSQCLSQTAGHFAGMSRHERWIHFLLCEGLRHINNVLCGFNVDHLCVHSGALCSQSAVCTVSARPASELCVFCAVSRDSYGCWRSSEAHWGWRQLRQNADNCDCVRRWVVTAAVMSSVSHLCLSSAITKPRCVVVDRETKSV